MTKFDQQSALDKTQWQKYLILGSGKKKKVFFFVF